MSSSSNFFIRARSSWHVGGQLPRMLSDLFRQSSHWQSDHTDIILTLGGIGNVIVDLEKQKRRRYLVTSNKSLFCVGLCMMIVLTRPSRKSLSFTLEAEMRNTSQEWKS